MHESIHTHTCPTTATLLAGSPAHGEACRLPAEAVRRVGLPMGRQSLAPQKDTVVQAHAVTKGQRLVLQPLRGPCTLERWQRGEEGAWSTGGVAPAGEAAATAGELGLGDVE